MPGIATALLLAAGVLNWWSVSSVRSGSLGRLRLGLLLVLLLGAGALGVTILEFSQLPFTWELNAYASIFWALGAYMMLLLIVALGMNLFVQVWAWQGLYTETDHAAVQNSALFLYGIIAFWIVTFGILYLVPYAI